MGALEIRDFRLYWSGQFFTQTGTSMQQAAVAWQIYLLTHSALALGLIGLFRVAPIVVFSLAGGVVTDVVDRRRLLIMLQPILLICSLLLALATMSGIVSTWMIYAITAAAAGTYAFVGPAQQAMVPNLVPRERLANALSLSSTSSQVATVLGPALAGLIIAAWSVAAVYWFDVASYLGPLIALFFIESPSREGRAERVSLGAAVEGLRFVGDTPIIMYMMLLDFVATFFGSATALLPIFARDILHVGSLGYGILYAAPSFGAVLAGIIISVRVSSIRIRGSIILLAVGAYAVCTILFGISRLFPLSLLLLAGTGAADTVSMIMRQTIRQTVTPDALRGRMSSVNMVFFMGGPQLGEFEAGVVARAFGAPFSVVVGGVGALLATVLIALSATGLRRYRV